MDTSFKIQGTTVVTAVTATRISKPIFYLDTENSIYRATVKAYDDDGNIVRTLERFLTQDEYDAWGTDDEYIHSLLFDKLGMTKIAD